MPLIQPDNLREKILAIADAGAGKTTAWLSIAWWAFVSGDTRKFYVLDTDDEAVLQVMNEPKYEGMVHSVNGEIVNEKGNVVIWSVYDWSEYQNFSDYTRYLDGKCVINQAQRGDWVVIDFVTTVWNAAQEGFLHDAAQKSRGEVLYKAGVEGKAGWDMFKEDFNWNAINGAYFDFIKPILIMNKAHVFMTSEMKTIQENASKLPDDQKDHLAQFGKFSYVGQKKLPHQCRSYLRFQNLARGRVLYTNGKDRAREWFKGEKIDPDFFKMYLVGRGGWSVE